MHKRFENTIIYYIISGKRIQNRGDKRGLNKDDIMDKVRLNLGLDLARGGIDQNKNGVFLAFAMA